MRIVALKALESYKFDQLFGATGSLRRGNPFELQAQFDISCHGSPGQETKFLEHHGTLLAGPSNGRIIEPYLSRVRFNEA